GLLFSPPGVKGLGRVWLLPLRQGERSWTFRPRRSLFSTEIRQMTPPSGPPGAAPAPPHDGSYTAVNYEHTTGFVRLLEHLGVSLLVSTYQAGKLLTVGTHQGALALGFHNFEQAMGVAVKPGRVAVGTRRQVWFLRSAPDVAPRVEPAGKYDACYLTRSAHFT